MKFFKSLNCCLCNLPFVPIANQPRSPRQLWCGLAMCHECFEMEKALKKEKRKHQCAYAESVCFCNPTFAYFLIDVLSRDFLTLLRTKLGYVLTEPEPSIVCPICHEEYSLTKSGKAPYDLYCNHTICDGCFSTIKKTNGDETWKYSVTCPTCKTAFNTSSTTRKNSLKEFLQELPEMIEEYEFAKMSTHECSGCKILNHIESMFNCLDCNVKICGSCTCRQHREHKFEDLVTLEVIRISKEVTDTSKTQIAGYEKNFSELHKQAKKVLNDFKKIILNKGHNTRNLMKIQEVLKQQEEIRQSNKEFESISEDYMPALRRFNTKMQDLLRPLEKDEKSRKDSKSKK